MKKIIAALTILLMASVFNSVATANFKIDYGDSKIYSRQDIDSAIEIVLATFNQWDGCELHSIRYGGDAANNADNVKWMNDLAEGQGYAPEFTQCLELLSDFHSPKNPPTFTAWNADSEYKDWQWWLARTDVGDWQLLTFGY